MSGLDSSAANVFIIDDDASVRRFLSRLVRQAGLEARVYSSAEDFLEAGGATRAEGPACLVLDLRMPGLGGLELQRKLSGDAAPCPVIFISGDGDIPSTVEAMKQGALTFLTKPFDSTDLLSAITEALEKNSAQLATTSHVSGIRCRIGSLTDREREVMAWVISGALNKQIAGVLGIVEQTVKVHRGRVMEKMRAVSVAELVRLCDSAGFHAADGTKV